MEPEKIRRRREVVFPHVLETFADGQKPRVYSTAEIKHVLAGKVDTSRKVSVYKHDYSYTESSQPFTPIQQVRLPQPARHETKAIGTPRVVGYQAPNLFPATSCPWADLGGSHGEIRIRHSMRLMNLRNVDMHK